MQFDASTIFVLALVVGIVLLLAWAEINSRRQPRSPDTDATRRVPAASQGTPRTPLKR